VPEINCSQEKSNQYQPNDVLLGVVEPHVKSVEGANATLLVKFVTGSYLLLDPTKAQFLLTQRQK